MRVFLALFTDACVRLVRLEKVVGDVMRVLMGLIRVKLACVEDIW